MCVRWVEKDGEEGWRETEGLEKRKVQPRRWSEIRVRGKASPAPSVERRKQGRRRAQSNNTRKTTLE